MEGGLVVYLREQAYAVDGIADACLDPGTEAKLRDLSADLLEKAAHYEELIALQKK